MVISNDCTIILQKIFGRILGNLRPAKHSLPPPAPINKSAYTEQGFFSLSKIQRPRDQKNFNSECLMCAHKTGTKE